MGDCVDNSFDGRLHSIQKGLGIDPHKNNQCKDWGEDCNLPEPDVLEVLIFGLHWTKDDSAIHPEHVAARTMPVVAKAAQKGVFLKAPKRIKNSPTKPFRPGRPMDDRVITRKQAEKMGSGFHRPPKSAIIREWRRS